jgi:hypothetical protein
MAMVITIRLAALVTVAAVSFAGVAHTLSTLNRNFGSQYSRQGSAPLNTDEQLGARKETDATIVEQKEAETKKQKEAEAKIAQQSPQLQFLYTYYIWMQICAERFTEFENTKAGLREVLRSKEVGFPPEQAESIWNAAADKFQQVESVLKIAGEARLYADCDRNGRYIEGLLTLVPGMEGPSSPLPRKKDF